METAAHGGPVPSGDAAPEVRGRPGRGHEEPSPRRERVRQLLARLRFVLAVIVAGAAAGAGAIAFYACLNLVQLIFWGGGAGGQMTRSDWLDAILANKVPALIDLAARAPWQSRLLLPALGGADRRRDRLRPSRRAPPRSLRAAYVGGGTRI